MSILLFSITASLNYFQLGSVIISLINIGTSTIFFSLDIPQKKMLSVTLNSIPLNLFLSSPNLPPPLTGTDGPYCVWLGLNGRLMTVLRFTSTCNE